MQSINVYFMRHGESQANDDGLVAGAGESPVTHRGKLQVAQAAYYLRERDIHFDLIISSPMTRSLDSAKALAEIIGYPEERIIALDSLSERGFGSYEGKPSSELDSANELVIASTGGESEAEFMERMKVCRAEIFNLSSSKEAKLVLIVSHSWVYRGLCAIVNEDYSAGDLGSRSRLKNANITFLTKM